MAKDDSSLDLLGAKPIAEAAKAVVEGSVSGASAFLSRICLPASEEFGYLIRDRVSHWRKIQAVKLTARAENIKLRYDKENRYSAAHPRLVMKAISDGSWSDDDQIIDMWAGLLASSCTEDGKSDDNLIFMTLLAQLNRTESLILNFAAENAPKFKTPAGFTMAHPFGINYDELFRLVGHMDVHLADISMDHLREVGLLFGESGFDPNEKHIVLQPSTLALSMYVRCQGFIGPPASYFPDLVEATYEGEID